MNLDRTPSPQPGGGWKSNGLTVEDYSDSNGRSRGPSTSKRYGYLNGGIGGGLSWESARATSERINAYPARNESFFGKHLRKISQSWNELGVGGHDDRYAEKEKLGRGRLGGRGTWADLPKRVGRLLWKLRARFAILLLLLLALAGFYSTPLVYLWRRASWLGGGRNFVILLAANQGGGVMQWKGPREWAIERDSVRNKKKYVRNWGYELEIVDMSTKKRYAHEWRESWEKVDVIRNAMRKYPKAEWFWWLDLNTFIMEPSVSLQSHIFNDINSITYRNINVYNPLGITHPPNGTHLTELEQTAAPGKEVPINLIVPQDCGGFNLGSFFVRRSSWTDRLLDIWWDPVFYEQRHMEWEHKEQDALEYIYTNQPWIRPHTAFIPQRMVNALPPGACGDDKGLPPGGCDSGLGDGSECGVAGVHYQESDRDFLVNMAGCEWGRDCWGEMYNYRQLSNKLNRSKWEKLKHWVSNSESKSMGDGGEDAGDKAMRDS